MSAPEDVVASSVSTSRASGAVPVWITTAPELPDGAVRLFALIAAKYTPRPGYVATSPTLPQLAAELGVNESERCAATVTRSSRPARSPWSSGTERRRCTSWPASAPTGRCSPARTAMSAVRPV